MFPSYYPCYTFLQAAGILEEFQTLLTNAGLDHFISDEPEQYVKLTMSVVQDFKFKWDTSNPMVQYKIYNKTVNLPFVDFCAAIRVPCEGVIDKLKKQPAYFTELYKRITNGRNFAEEAGKSSKYSAPFHSLFCLFYFQVRVG